MGKKTIAALFGGRSPEHDISKLSAGNIISFLDKKKYDVLPVYITKEGKWLLYDGSFDRVENIPFEKFGTPAVLSPDTGHRGFIRMVGDKFKIIPVDFIFIAMHGQNGEDGTIQGLCELSGIPYSGSGVAASAVGMDKDLANKFAESIGLSQAKFIVALKEEMSDSAYIVRKIGRQIKYPCFVKPANAGSSVGITKVKSKSEAEAALQLAFSIDRKAVIERAVVGRELECAVLGNENPLASGVGEILPAAEFYDYDAKYNSSESKTSLSADIPEEIREEIRESAVKIYKAIGASGLARVDFFLENGTNRVLFNEINTLPGFTAISLYPLLWKEAGIEAAELIDKLIELGLSRK